MGLYHSKRLLQLSYRSQNKTHNVVVQQSYGNQKQYFCNRGLARYKLGKC